MAKQLFSMRGRLLSAAGLLIAASVSQAAIAPFSDDFESYGTTGIPSQSDFTSPGGWIGFSNNCGFPGGYSFLPSTSGPQIAALGYNGSDNQYINIYANYDNAPCHTGAGPLSQEQLFVYQQQSFTGADTASGATWMFKFNYRQADVPPGGSTQVAAFIRVFDPVFNILAEATLDTDVSGEWRTGVLTVELDPAWVSGNIQFGFTNTTGNYEDSGVFYDEVVWESVIPAVADVEPGYGGGGNQLHPHHDGRFLTLGALPDDVVPVVVYGAATSSGDPVDLNVAQIATVRFGPGPNSAPFSASTLDVDSDGLNDTRFNFNMSDTELLCGEQSGTLVGELTTGDSFVGTDTFNSNCNAQCHR